jgi:hypothetical protein
MFYGILMYMKKCIECDKELKGRQTKYCSGLCKSRTTNKIYQAYSVQKNRGIARKLELFNLMGGMCVGCGYKKNLAAIDFHHKDKKNKSFKVDLRIISNSRYKIAFEELKKCVPLCSNCHREEHNPDFNVS